MAIEPRKYETLYLVRPDISPEDLLTIQNRVEQSVTGNGGEILKSEKWAEKDLAYRIDNYTRGTYYIAVYAAESKAVTDIERYFNLSKNNVLRFMTVNYIEEEQKAADAAMNVPPRPSEQEDQSAFRTPSLAPEEQAEGGDEPSQAAAEQPREGNEPSQAAAEQPREGNEPSQAAAEQPREGNEPSQAAAEQPQGDEEKTQGGDQS
ncbi:MAG: 30S ribosomal protein S6 [Candidatus Dadabacteria bacterium]|nr:30S ribosomal protein S6 [Candidatus Dadabacteria bacterium]